MSESFLILSHRFGGDTRDPTDSVLEDALEQVFNENHPELTEADYEEHRGASLRFGRDNGPMFVVHVDRRGDMVFEQWADADYEKELFAPLFLHRVTFDCALRLWKLAKAGDVSSLCQEPWAQD